jgi:hypothetical protein
VIQSWDDWDLSDVVYYESRKWELKIRLMNEGRFDERLKARVDHRREVLQI